MWPSFFNNCRDTEEGRIKDEVDRSDTQDRNQSGESFCPCGSFFTDKREVSAEVITIQPAKYKRIL
jgi:hypothetical protein